MKSIKKVIIVGMGGHSEVILNILKRDYKNKYHLIGYVDLEENRVHKELKYFGKDSELENIFRKGICKNLIIGIGYIRLDTKRKELIKKLENIGFDFPSIISKKAIINENVKIGRGSLVFDNVVVNSQSLIGNYCILNTSCVIEHNSEIGDFTHIAPGAIVCGGSKIGENCMIGANSTIIQYKTICDDVLIGAGSVVNRDILSRGIYAGVPVKKLKEKEI